MVSQQENQSSTPKSRSFHRTTTSGRRRKGHFQGLNEAEHEGLAVHRSNTAPASYGHVLPIQPARQTPTNMTNESNRGSISNEPGGPVGSEDDPWTKTMHIHLDKDRPEDTELCRCLLDTGSDFNLISETTLLTLHLPFNKRRGPGVTGIGGAQIFPIGSVVLTWHMDGQRGKTYYETFWVISEDTPALFDVLIGKEWIKKTNALLKNPKVLLSRFLPLHLSPMGTRRGAETSTERSC